MQEATEKMQEATENNSIYIILKDGSLGGVRDSLNNAIELGKQLSGLNINMPLGEVDIWESNIPNDKENKLVWSVKWESRSMYPNVYVPQYK